MNFQPYKPTTERPWNLRRVWTLHRRVGFAATWSELQRDLADGPVKSIDWILAGECRGDGVPGNFPEMSRVIGDSAVASDRPERLGAWWIYQMYFSPDPLRERMAILWHNHFATSNAKLENVQLMREQNEIFRHHAMGDFKKLLSATLKHAAMLKWLDGDENRAGKANENLGRETLELFTLGVGIYTEADVKDASRALTGWSVSQNKFVVRDDWHDANEKTILGQKGNFAGDDLVEIASKHESTARRLAWRLCSEFLSPEVATDDGIGELARILTESKLNLRVAVETILRSELFFSDENLKRRIVEPESFVVGAVRALEIFGPPASTMVLVDWVEQLGRKLFYPPNVGGWPGGRAWLNSRTIIARANFGVSLVSGGLHQGGAAPDLAGLVQRRARSAALPDAAVFFSELLTGTTPDDGGRELATNASEGLNDANEILRNMMAQILASPGAQLG